MNCRLPVCSSVTRALRPATTTTFSKATLLPTTTFFLTTRPISTTPNNNLKMYKDSEGNKRSEEGKKEPHQHQSSNRTDRPEDQWKFRAPYKIHDDKGGENFEAKWKGKCHCGAVQYELSREKPLASKYCHCTTCQRMHGVSF